MKTLILATSTLVLIGAAIPATAGPRHHAWDQIEDRLDRLENRRDERVDHGRRDRLEDHVDRWEDRRDRLGKPTPNILDRLEHRSWKRRWGN